MATIDLGKIKQVFRGTYNNATAYVPDDLVVFTDTNITSTYICTTASTGNNPSSGGTAHANWAYVAKGVADPIPSQSGQSGKFLTTNGSALSFGDVSAGITMADQWRVHSNFNSSSSSHLVNSNWERNDSNFAQIGTGMTESSGVFTFPQTGIYLIMFQLNCQGSNMQYMGAYCEVSPDNGSSYYARAENYDSGGGTGHFGSTNYQLILDVTNASLFKIRFRVASSGAITTEATTNSHRTGVTFIRLGDT